FPEFVDRDEVLSAATLDMLLRHEWVYTALEDGQIVQSASGRFSSNVCAVVAPPGSGKTRYLDELGARLVDVTQQAAADFPAAEHALNQLGAISADDSEQLKT